MGPPASGAAAIGDDDVPAALAGTDSGQPGALRVACVGSWSLFRLEAATAALSAALASQDKGPLVIDLGAVSRLDMAGGMILARTILAERRGGRTVTVSAGRHGAILDLALGIAEGSDATVPTPPPLSLLHRLGGFVIDRMAEAYGLLGFLGLALAGLMRVVFGSGRLRPASIVVHMQRTGLEALPIIGLLAFLVGMVLAYQSAFQLERFGAGNLAINVLGISVLREFGVLIAAIIVAGRSGSAFAAQLGSMRVAQEVDALATLGLDPVEVLVLPRVVALTLAMPLLAFFADLAALAGGAAFLMATQDLTLQQFVTQLKDAIRINGFLVGILKAPVFGMAIAVIGCHEGLKVSGGADAVGRHTTRAVVVGIFFVIVLDAAFSVAFTVMGI